MTVCDRIRICIKFLFSREKELYLFFGKLVGTCPRDIRLYHQACIHRSLHIVDAQGRRVDNERLEFLGDAVLDAIIADALYRRFPDWREGQLTALRSELVKRATLNLRARQIGLSAHVESRMGVTSCPANLAGNALEALVGAVYIDSGYRRCAKFVESKLVEPYLESSVAAMYTENPKSALLEWCQKHRVECSYHVEQQVDGLPSFTATVYLSGVAVGCGEGRTKREAHQQASGEAMKKLCNPEFAATLSAGAVKNA